MITQEHLEYWINKIRYQLNGIKGHVAKTDIDGLMVENSDGKKVHISFEYLDEKATTIARTLGCIEDDIKND